MLTVSGATRCGHAVRKPNDRTRKVSVATVGEHPEVEGRLCREQDRPAFDDSSAQKGSNPEHE